MAHNRINMCELRRLYLLENNLEDILNAKVFDGKSICYIWDKVSWYSLDGCRIEERLPYYIDDNKQQPLRSAPRSFK